MDKMDGNLTHVLLPIALKSTSLGFSHVLNGQASHAAALDKQNHAVCVHASLYLWCIVVGRTQQISNRIT